MYLDALKIMHLLFKFLSPAKTSTTIRIYQRTTNLPNKKKCKPHVRQRDSTLPSKELWETAATRSAMRTESFQVAKFLPKFRWKFPDMTSYFFLFCVCFCGHKEIECQIRYLVRLLMHRTKVFSFLSFAKLYMQCEEYSKIWLNLTFAALNLTFIRGHKAFPGFHADRVIGLPCGQGQPSRIWKVQCDWLSLGKECCSRLSKCLWGQTKYELP